MGRLYRWDNALTDYMDGHPADLLAMLEADADPPEDVRAALARAIRRALLPVKAPAFAEATVAALLPEGPIPESARIGLAALIRSAPLLKKPVRLTIAERRKLREIMIFLRATPDADAETRANFDQFRRQMLRRLWPDVSPKTLRESLERLKRRR